MIATINFVLLSIIVIMAVLKSNRCHRFTSWFHRIAWWSIGVGAFASLAWRVPVTWSELLLNFGITLLVVHQVFPWLYRIFWKPSVRIYKDE